jgi:hypothetical protein
MEMTPSGTVAVADGIAGAHEIEHYIHSRGTKPIVAVGAPHHTLKEVLVRFGIEVDAPEGSFVFVGECVEALDEPAEVDDGVDAHAPVDVSLTLEVLEVEKHLHVHHHTCRHIAVEVAFLDSLKRHRFSPATPIKVVTEWARNKFPSLDPVAAADYVLRIVGTKVQPRAEDHLGEIVAKGTCAISFELVKDATHLG